MAESHQALSHESAKCVNLPAIQQGNEIMAMLRDLDTRITNEFQVTRNYMEERFNQMDKRFNKINKRFYQMEMDKRFNQMEERFNQLELK
ncbi:hypothetical protein F4821DRAFT_230028 [Hypoxylon rubiginosum]|uniref:Uncharacterized protein n=1 Tax=Hypoxylon rubiginosum TaxID=110542 RepID=A0ACC0DAS7_9PEZI|nr:hypothetical protein F4821DRAFT_230028 [Hypoxylon rubiginosum]